MPHNARETNYRRLLDETGSREQYEYLTVQCSTRKKSTATRARGLINQGQYAKALKLADPIAYQVGLNDYSR